VRQLKQRIAAYHDLLGDRARIVAPPIEHAVQHRMNHKAARVRLVRGAHQLPAFAEAIGDQCEIGGPAERIVEALHAGERLRRSVKSLFGKQRGPQPVARGVATLTLLPACRGIRQTCGLRRRGPECKDHLRLIEREQFAAAGHGTEHAQVEVMCQPLS